MNYTTSTKGDIFLVNLTTQRATVDIVAELKDELLMNIEDGKFNVIVDLTDVEYVDSAFLGVLVTGLKRSAVKGGQLKLVLFQPQVRGLFELMKLYKVFDIFYSIEDALNSFTK